MNLPLPDGREPSWLLGEIIAFTKAEGRAPTPAEVRVLAVFTEAGPIARLCHALSDAAEVFALALKVRP